MARKRRPPRPGALTDLAPLPILRKIILLQTAYYVSAAILIIFTLLVAGKEVRLDAFLDWKAIRIDTTVGWMLAMVWVLNSLVVVIFLLLIVVRSKLVTDFALSTHLIHLIVTTTYTKSLPTSLFWWGVQAFSAMLMTFLGVWVCQWRELRPISFGGFGNNTSHNTSNPEELYELIERQTVL